MHQSIVPFRGGYFPVIGGYLFLPKFLLVLSGEDPIEIDRTDKFMQRIGKVGVLFAHLFEEGFANIRRYDSHKAGFEDQ